MKCERDTRNAHDGWSLEGLVIGDLMEMEMVNRDGDDVMVMVMVMVIECFLICNEST